MHYDAYVGCCPPSENQRNHSDAKGAKGVTLVELIVVITVILVLSAVLIPNILSYIEKANLARANANAKEVYTYVMEYWSESVAEGRALPHSSANDFGNDEYLTDVYHIYPQYQSSAEAAGHDAMASVQYFLSTVLPNGTNEKNAPLVSITIGKDGYPTRVTWASYTKDTMVGCYPTPAVGRNTKGNIKGNTTTGKGNPGSKGYAPNLGEDDNTSEE